MNERILELADEARIKFSSHWAHEGVDTAVIMRRDLKEFAELIVQKFDDILILEYLDCVGNKDQQAAERVQRLRERVKTYFGVEE